MIRTTANFRSLYHITHISTAGPKLRYTKIPHPSASYTTYTTTTTTTTLFPQIQHSILLSSKSFLRTTISTRCIVFQRNFVTSPAPPPPSPKITASSSDSINMIGQIIQRSKPPSPTIKTDIPETTTKMILKSKVIPKSTTKKVISTTGNNINTSSHTKSLQIVRVGLPLILFSVLAAWVVSNAYGGKLKELEVSQGKSSISIRQATLEAEHDEMMERLNHIVNSDYDNTKRIQRPEEVLEQRRLERQRRNVWYRRWYRAVTGQQE